MKFRAPHRSFARRQHPWRAIARLCVESLECRTTPSLTPWPGLNNPVVEAAFNDTANVAQDLGLLDPGQRGEAVGTIGEADVDWFKFSLDRAARVVLTTLNELAGTSLVSVLSLYNEDAESWSDPHNPEGNRQLAQADAADHGQQDVRVIRHLPAGTYYVAMSGSGNRDFHPYLADSGQLGSMGDYGLLITVEDLALDPTDGPAVVSMDPEEGAVLTESPFVLRVTFHEALDTSTLPVDPSMDNWVQLRYDAAGVFGDGDDEVVPLSVVNFSSAVNELQLTPRAPLRPGFYQVFLAGDTLTWPTVLRDLDGNPLGFSANHPDGADFLAGFQIDGSEGIQGALPQADDTLDTARALGELVVDQFIQWRGAIGDDPAYDPTLLDPFLIDPFATDLPPYLFNPAAEVDVYSFQITGAGSYLLVAEVWAGRIGSPLDPALSLYRREGPGEAPTLLAVNDSTMNPILSANGRLPLFADSSLLWNLTAGDYFVVVGGNENLPTPGAEGVFDPTVAHSGRVGFATGRYVFNLGLRQDVAPPEVLHVTPENGETLVGPPRHLLVQFSEYMNLHQLAIRGFLETTQSTVNAVWVEASDGTRYFPRLDTYDTATNVADFLMLDGLVSGDYTLHLSGALGLGDVAGNPLIGNHASNPLGDYVIAFTVNGPARDFNGLGQLVFAAQEPNDSSTEPQDLGVLFPHEMNTGVVVTRDFTADPASTPADTADFYRFEVLQSQSYRFQFNNHNLPPGVQPQLEDSNGNAILLSRVPATVSGAARLTPGVYTLRIAGWAAASAADLQYELHLRILGAPDNPPPVATGALSASRFRLVTNTPPAPPAPAGAELPPPSGESPPAGEVSPPVILHVLPPEPPVSPPPAPPSGELPSPGGDPAPPPSGSQPIEPISITPAETNATPPAQVTLPVNPVVPPVAPKFDVVASPVAPTITTDAPPVDVVAPPALPTVNTFVPQGPASQPLGPEGGTRTTEPTPLPSPSVLLVVTLVTPTIPETTTATVLTPTLTLSVRPPEGAVVPALLSSLRSGPVGAAQDANGREALASPINLPTPGANLIPTTELLVRTNSSSPADLSGSAATVLDAPPLVPTSATPAAMRSWQQALDLFFSMPQGGFGSLQTLPGALWQEYQQLHQLWNEAFQSLFGATEQEGSSESPPEWTDEYAGEESVSSKPSHELEQALVGAGAGLVAFNLHREPSRQARRGRRRREQEEG